MATLQQVIQLVFEGVDNASETAGKVSKSLDTLGGVATNIADPFSDLAAIIEKIDATFAIFASTIGVLAVRESAKFTQSLSDLDRFLKIGEGSAKNYTDTFKDLSLKYGIGVNDIIASTSDWSAANYNINQSLDLTRIALDYATAGQISAAESTDILKKILSGLNTDLANSTATAMKWGDVINFVADDSKSNFKELATAVSLLAPSFSSSGFSIEQFVSVIGSSVDLLQSGSGAADGLKTIFGSLIKTTDDGAQKFKEFNIVVGEGNIVQGSVKETLTKIAAIWPTLTEEQKANAAITLTSKERADQFKNILDKWPETANRATKAVSLSTESMAKEVERALATSIAAFNRFAQAINQLLISLGLELEPTTVVVSDSLTALAAAFDKLITSGALDPLLNVLRAQGVELANTFTTIAANLPKAFQGVDLSGIADAFGDLGQSVKEFFDALFGGIDLSTVEGLKKALQQIADGGEALIRVTGGIIRAFIPFAEAIDGSVKAFNKLDEASKVDFGDFLGTMQAIVNFGPKAALAIILAAKAGIDWAESADKTFGAVKFAVNAVQISFDGLRLIVDALAGGIAVFARTIAYLRGDTQGIEDIDKALAGLKKGFDENLLSLEQNKRELNEGYKRSVEGSSQSLSELRASLGSTENGIRNFGNETKKAAVELGVLADIKLPTFEAVPEKAIENVKQITKASQELIPTIISIRDENGNVTRSWTQLTGVIPGVTGTLSYVKTAYNETADKAKEATKESDNFRTKMEEIASNERIKIIEAVIDLKVATVEADAKRVIAAFESIDSAVQNTGDLLGSLFGNLAGADTYTKLAIQSQIDLENKRRQEALDIQKKLAEAEIGRIEAQTRALERGDAILKIDGTGLAPQLEAFMWEILKAIRIRANAEFADYLLGVT